jgi:flagellar biosynthesis protein FlhG
VSHLKLVPQTPKKAPRARKARKARGALARLDVSAPLPRPTVRTVAVVSGKGGVGKSNVVANLGVAMAQLGASVLVLDADLGQANQDVLLGVHPRADLLSVLRGDCALADIVLEGPAGVRLVPAGSGDPLLVDVDDVRRERLYREIGALAADADIVLIDTASGASRQVAGFALAARELLLITTPEPTSYADAYGLLKVLARQGLSTEPGLLVNLSTSVEDAEEVAHRLASVARRFLRLDLHMLGHVPLDPALPQAVKRQEPVVLSHPNSPSARALARLAARLLTHAPDGAPVSWPAYGSECA